jgi:DNA-binding transcriptional regulator YiaG
LLAIVESRAIIARMIKRRIYKTVNELLDTFPAVLGVSTRTLQDWEQDRRQLTGPARSLLRIADRHPEALLG